MSVRRALAFLAALAIASSGDDSSRADEGASSAPPPLVDVWVAGEGIAHTYRIPALLAPGGDALLAFCEARRGGRSDAGDIDLVVRRSDDRGETWGETVVVWDDGANTCGNPCPVLDRDTGRIWLPMTWNHESDHERQIMAGDSRFPRRAYVTYSDDGGATWAPPRDISASTRAPHWRWYATGPGNAIQLRHGEHAGRLLVPANHSDHSDDAHPYRSHVFWSDDHGETWTLGGVVGPATNESAVVELARGGAVMDNMRSYAGKNRRAVATSSDGGATWTSPRLDDELLEPVCQASLVRHSFPTGDAPGRLLFANPASKQREKLTVRVSRDDGESWPDEFLVYPGSAAYSSLAVFPDGEIALLFERDGYSRISLARLSLDDIEDGDSDDEPGGAREAARSVTFTRQRIAEEYFAEGASVGDFDGDGERDVVCGPYWFEGPEFETRHVIYEGRAFPNDRGYSDNFFSFVHDFSGDGRDDVLVVGLPGTPSHWYENPHGDGHWTKHPAFPVVDNEAPIFEDLDGDDVPDLICGFESRLGYVRWDPSSPREPWTWHPISAPGKWHKYTHGLGIGDVDGDGRKDYLTTDGWWKQPESLAGDPEWEHHPVRFGQGGAQIWTYDVDADGDADVVTSVQAHGWGLSWYEQVVTDEPGRTFREHAIMTSSAGDFDHSVAFSQLHAVELVDVDGDGARDIVTGKCYWAHNGGDPGARDPAVLYWFRLERSDDGPPRFVPHRIDDDSGTGRQIRVVDIDGDGRSDVVAGNKKGVFVFRQRDGDASAD